MDAQEERIARNEALFREVNERIAESAQRFESQGAEFVCECADQDCTERVEATLDEYERVLISRALSMAAGNVADAARRLKTDRPNLYRRMRRLGIPIGNE